MDHLEELVKGYRSFGFVPVVYEPSVDIGMTQIEDTVVFILMRRMEMKTRMGMGM